MKTVIEPAINVYTKEEYIRRILAVREIAEIVQLDVIDGVFARPGNFNDPAIVQNLLAPEKIDLHIMAIDLDKELKRWLPIKPARIILHIEYPGALERHFALLNQNNIKKGLAIAPFTSLEKIYPFAETIDYLLVMSVNPGAAGQQFLAETPKKLEVIHKKFPKLLLGVDGGVREEHFAALKKSGAGNIVVGAGFFNADAQTQMRLLKN